MPLTTRLSYLLFWYLWQICFYLILCVRLGCKSWIYQNVRNYFLFSLDNFRWCLISILIFEVSWVFLERQRTLTLPARLVHVPCFFFWSLGCSFTFVFFCVICYVWLFSKFSLYSWNIFLLMATLILVSGFWNSIYFLEKLTLPEHLVHFPSSKMIQKQVNPP